MSFVQWYGLMVRELRRANLPPVECDDTPPPDGCLCGCGAEQGEPCHTARMVGEGCPVGE